MDQTSADWPKIGVVGFAGPIDKNTVEVTNCPHWPLVIGDKIAELC